MTQIQVNINYLTRVWAVVCSRHAGDYVDMRVIAL